MDTAPTLSATQIAEFLKTQPDFFQQYADIFAGMTVPHPQHAKAISLGERQILVLREKNKYLDKQLNTLLHNARRNEKINQLLHQWYCRMLAEPSEQALPTHICHSLQDIFELPICKLALWDQTTDYAELRQHIQEHNRVYCGPAHSEACWQDLQDNALSVATIPLFQGEILRGVLLLGANDATRFTRDMDTTFLTQIGQICSATLQRLPANTDEQTS
ncbi:DUF484 family protein [Alcaligenes endophyticus]|uniref:DUF484 family protein n=1 Tax=Alcaligenes endophyticus TaxID=1929088 RepID=A0ABT8EGA5_9BURK|nr:DUF484 family protein [Alcaligenes endophyticus]MCX5590034.1 DUF484 family protein [Alcaligenes endophyticus]MDN4120303.1 DUF484 family protein [Alcaligenes endophyticus]